MDDFHLNETNRGIRIRRICYGLVWPTIDSSVTIEKWCHCRTTNFGLESAWNMNMNIELGLYTCDSLTNDDDTVQLSRRRQQPKSVHFNELPLYNVHGTYIKLHAASEIQMMNDCVGGKFPFENQTYWVNWCLKFEHFCSIGYLKYFQVSLCKIWHSVSGIRVCIHRNVWRWFIGIQNQTSKQNTSQIHT